MPVLSYVHQLFRAEQCQAYIHTLRWKDRPLQCPRCQSHDVHPWGTYHYRPGLHRYWCKGCRRTFNDLTHTLLAQTKRSLAHWIVATFLVCLSCSSRRIARELGVHIQTSYRWCWWLRNTALSYEMERQLAGTVEADELYHTAGRKGQAKRGGKKPLGRRARGRRKKREPGRGHYDKDRPAISPSRRCKRRPTSRCKPAVVSTRTRPAAIGRCRAMYISTSIIPRRNMRAATCMRIEPSACFPCSSPISGCSGVSAKQTCQGTLASFNFCGTFVNGMRLNRLNSSCKRR
jgi:transposase-like protein